MIRRKNIIIALIVWVAAIILCCWAFTCVNPQTVTFPKSTQSVLVHWSHDQAGKGTVWYRVYWSTGSIDNIPDTLYVLNHSLIGDSTVIYATAYWRAYPDIESVPSNKVTTLFKDAIIPPPPTTYLALPYDADWLRIKADFAGVAIYRDGYAVMYGLPAVATPMWLTLTFDLAEAGTYLCRAEVFGYAVTIQGKYYKLSGSRIEWVEQELFLPKGRNTIKLSVAEKSCELSRFQLSRVGVKAPPNAPVLRIEVKP